MDDKELIEEIRNKIQITLTKEALRNGAKTGHSYSDVCSCNICHSSDLIAYSLASLIRQKELEARIDEVGFSCDIQDCETCKYRIKQLQSQLKELKGE